MSFHTDADELRIKISNYKRTRQTSVGPIRAWCDRLIQDAEDELRRLSSDVQHASQHDISASLAATAAADSTYPLA